MQICKKESLFGAIAVVPKSRPKYMYKKGWKKLKRKGEQLYVLIQSNLISLDEHHDNTCLPDFPSKAGLKKKLSARTIRRAKGPVLPCFL